MPLARAQFQEIAQNRGEVKGAYAYVKNPSDKADRDKAVDEVVKHIDEAANILVQISKDPSKLKDDDVKGPIAQSVWRIYKTMAKDPKEVVWQGFSGELDKAANPVATRKILVTRDELKRLTDTLDFLDKRLGGFSDPDERPDLTSILGTIQSALLGTVTGQEVRDNDKIAGFIVDLPFRTNSLQVTAADLKGYTAVDYDKWLQDLRRALKISRDLEKRMAAEGSVSKRPGKGNDEYYMFFFLTEIP
jgi:hypothetical protein